jgi:DNA-binding NarL/FixJ family response regulator
MKDGTGKGSVTSSPPYPPHSPHVCRHPNSHQSDDDSDVLGTGCLSQEAAEGLSASRIVMPLSARQIAVLQVVVDVPSIAAAAETLGVAPSTVHNHLCNMRQLLGLCNTWQVIAWGFRNGVLK